MPHICYIWIVQLYSVSGANVTPPHLIHGSLGSHKCAPLQTASWQATWFLQDTLVCPRHKQVHRPWNMRRIAIGCNYAMGPHNMKASCCSPESKRPHCCYHLLNEVPNSHTVPRFHPSPYPKQLTSISSCRAHGCDQQTDRHTERSQNTGNNRPHLMLCVAMQPKKSSAKL